MKFSYLTLTNLDYFSAFALLQYLLVTSMDYNTLKVHPLCSSLALLSNCIYWFSDTKITIIRCKPCWRWELWADCDLAHLQWIAIMLSLCVCMSLLLKIACKKMQNVWYGRCHVKLSVMCMQIDKMIYVFKDILKVSLKYNILFKMTLRSKRNLFIFCYIIGKMFYFINTTSSNHGEFEV